MRALFMGTSAFAVPILRALHEISAHAVLCVVTQPDRPQGRGGQLAASPVKQAAQALGLPLLQPERVRSADFARVVREMAPDVLAVAAFGQIIPQRVLDVPVFGGVNVHGSLLPRWRGAAPMQYALMAGDDETGVTTMQMDAGLDTGDILLQASCSLADVENWGTLEPRLASLGASLLTETLTLLAQGNCPRRAQEARGVTLAPSLAPDAGLLAWSRPARELHNLVRGVTPRPGAYTFWQGKRLKVWLTAPAVSEIEGESQQTTEAGVVQNVSAQGIMVATGSGALRLVDVQPEGRTRMAAAEWARGARVKAGERMGVPPPP